MYVAHTATQLRQAMAQLIPPPVSDVKPSNRRIPLSRSHHVRGWHPIRPGHGSVGFESRLESRFLTVIAQVAPGLTVQSQPVTIIYVLQGRDRRYTPDFLVHLPTVPEPLKRLGFGLQTYVEIKPLERARQLDEEWMLRLASLRTLGLPVTMVTDFDVAQLLAEANA